MIITVSGGQYYWQMGRGVQFQDVSRDRTLQKTNHFVTRAKETDDGLRQWIAERVNTEREKERRYFATRPSSIHSQWAVHRARSCLKPKGSMCVCVYTVVKEGRRRRRKKKKTSREIDNRSLQILEAFLISFSDYRRQRQAKQNARQEAHTSSSSNLSQGISPLTSSTKIKLTMTNSSEDPTLLKRSAIIPSWIPSILPETS